MGSKRSPKVDTSEQTPTTVTQALCRRIAADAEEALKAVAAKYGMTLTRDGGSFSPAAFTPKFKFEIVTSGGVPAEFASLAPMFGLEATDFGKSFVSGGKTYTINGIAPRSTRFPILASCNGREYKFSADSVKAMLLRSAA